MLRSSLLLSVLLSSAAFGGINFVADFEAGSKWYTESWSADARTEMQAYLSDLGALFDSQATVRVRITDDEDNAYASAGSTWNQWYVDPSTGNYIIAPALWMIVVKGITNPAAASDAKIDWNLDVSIYGGNSAALIGNIRGLGRHEMHHAFGSSSYLFFDSANDTRGTQTYASVIDTLYRDVNGLPLLGAHNSTTRRYTVNNFTLAANWATANNASGLYFEARDRQGRVVAMPPISGGGEIDFSHVKGIAYANDHPTWSTYVDTDLNFLRAMGYPLAVDSALIHQPASLTDYTLGSAQASLTFATMVGRHYRLATSTNLKNWSVSPVGKPGTGAPLGFTHPLSRATEPKRFFQVVEVPE